MKTHPFPFALTARCQGFPRKLYTPILVLNLDSDTPCAARVNAMWDTGAEYCVMSTRLARMLGLDYKHEVACAALTGSSQSKVGRGVISLVSGGGVIDAHVCVVDNPVGGGEYSFIIGMEVIRMGALAISHTETETILSFAAPAPYIVDFTSPAVDDRRPMASVPLSYGLEKIQIFKDKDLVPILASLLSSRTLKNFF